MHTPIVRGLALLAAGAMSLSAVSCGGGGTTPQMVLVGFNLPNIAGVTLNQPLIFTFSDDLNPATVTPDTVQVVGTPSFNFERIVIDGNLASMLPRVPNFEDYSDSGLAASTTYSVFMPVLPAIDTVRSVNGRPLVSAEPFNFTTLPVPTFIEPRRPIVYAPGPPGGAGDDDGCINNADNEFFLTTPPSVFQFATDADARLLCLKNEGPPRILGTECTPFHDQRGIGSPSASAPGTLDLGAIRLIFNEPLDPVSVVPYVPTTKFSINVQLWLVGDTAANMVTPVQVQTNKPLVVQDLSHTEVILVASGPVQQGTYLVNVQGVKDLPGNLVKTDDDARLAPPFYLGGYDTTLLTGKVPPGYRLFFRTLALPATNGSFTEAFSSGFNEGIGNTVGPGAGTRTFSRTLVNDLNNPIPGAVLPQPGQVLTALEPGQSTTANWNSGTNLLGLPGAPANNYLDDGVDRLKAVFQPWLGTATDGDASGNLVVSGGTSLHFEPDLAHPNGRIWQFNNLTIDPGATLTLIGDRPAMILVRGNFVNNGTIQASGATGRYGLDSDVIVASPLMWTHALTPRIGGPGGVGGPGGGSGGQGSPKVTLPFGGDAANGAGGINVFNFYDAPGNPALGFGLFGLSTDTTNAGGGGGGYGSAGTAGSPAGANAGSGFGAADFSRALSLFVPDRTFMPNADISGGGGGAGGGGENDDGASETGDAPVTISQGGGDDGGAGGGGGGGAVWVMANNITLGASSSILCDGGRGGNTYAFAQQSVLDPDGMAASGDEYVIGLSVVDTTPGTGQGGGGGGGAGGGILLQARTKLLVDSGAQLRARGGAGGTAAGGRIGGAGGDGRIVLLASVLSTDGLPYENNTAPGNMTPTPGLTGATWQPTVDTVSTGVSTWFDLTTPTADFKQPFFIDNFAQLLGDGLVRGTDFDAFFEVQGADGPALLPTQADATSGTGVTPWTPIAFLVPPAGATMAVIDNKRFVRWRWRFFVRDGYPQGPPALTPSPMPAILDFTLPFQK